METYPKFLQLEKWVSVKFWSRIPRKPISTLNMTCDLYVELYKGKERDI